MELINKDITKITNSLAGTSRRVVSVDYLARTKQEKEYFETARMLNLSVGSVRWGDEEFPMFVDRTEEHFGDMLCKLVSR